MTMKKLTQSQQLSVADLLYFYNVYCKMREQADRFIENADQSKRVYRMLGASAQIVKNMQNQLGLETKLQLISERELEISIRMSQKMVG